MHSKSEPRSQSMNDQPQSSPASGVNSWLLVGIFVLASAGAWAFAEFVLWNKLPSALVGKWVVEGGEQDGATFDFHRSGVMVGRVNLNGREGIINAQVEMEGNKLLTTTRNPNTGQDETRTQVIQTLTRDRLVLIDSRGQTLRLARAH